MNETGLTGKRRPTTVAATPDDGNSQRKRRICAPGEGEDVERKTALEGEQKKADN